MHVHSCTPLYMYVRACMCVCVCVRLVTLVLSAPKLLPKTHIAPPLVVSPSRTPPSVSHPFPSRFTLVIVGAVYCFGEREEDGGGASEQRRLRPHTTGSGRRGLEPTILGGGEGGGGTLGLPYMKRPWSHFYGVCVGHEGLQWFRVRGTVV